MAYNFDRIPSRRDPVMWNRWTNYPRDVLSMSIADTDFPVAPQIQRALHRQVEHGVLGYEAPTKAYFNIIVTRMKKLYDWDIDPDWVVYTAGVNNGYNIAARVLCDSEKGYLIQTPVYNEFQEAEHKTGIPQRTARLEKKVSGNRISYDVDFDAFRSEAQKAGMFLLCHPHNPIGKIYSREELKHMAEICLESKVTIVSDEIHSELLLGDAAFAPLAGISREIERNSITLISASKAFNVPGLACAFAIIPDDERRKGFQAMANNMSFEISSPGLTAARVAYSGKADAWLKSVCRYLTANRDFVIEYVQRHLPGIRTTRPDATYLMWLDCSELDLKPSPFEFFLKEAKVALSDGGRFGKGSERFVRLNFGTSRKLLKQGLDRMRRALESL